MTIHWKAVEHYFTMVLFVFQFYPVCNFGTFIRFGLGTVRSERVNRLNQQLLFFSRSMLETRFLERPFLRTSRLRLSTN